MNPPPIVIAEAGVNHNGSVELAHRLVDAAAEAGADFVKFQTFRADTLATRTAPKAAYQQRSTGSEQSQFEMLRALELSHDDFRALAAHCAQRSIGFLSTPFDSEAARFLAELPMHWFKVSSGDLTNTPLLRDIAAHGRPVILSTGMADLGEVEQAVRTLEACGLHGGDIALLHCTTEYPAPADEVNLRAMATLRAAFPGVRIGYSDHTEGFDITAAAVALGAEIVEKHFTLDRSLPGPDHRASLEPAELAAMVRMVRRVHAALGDGRKRPSASELPNRDVARKSIVAARAIRKGEVLDATNLAVRRPGTGMSPARWDEVVGTVAARDYERDEGI